MNGDDEMDVDFLVIVVNKDIYVRKMELKNRVLYCLNKRVSTSFGSK